MTKIFVSKSLGGVKEDSPPRVLRWDDAPRPPALTGSNRLFQTTTMFTPNSGKSERGRRHTPTDRQNITCQKPPIPLTYRAENAKSSKQQKKQNTGDDSERTDARYTRTTAETRVCLQPASHLRFALSLTRAHARARAPVQSPCTVLVRTFSDMASTTTRI